MKTATLPTCVLGASLLLVLLFCLWPLLNHPWILDTRTAVDINSGGFREETSIFGIRIADEVRTSVFSIEVRRLGIQVSGKPIWKYMYRRGLIRRHNSLEYGYAVHSVHTLVGMLDVLKTPDDERKVILRKTLRSLQTGRIDEIDEQLKRLASLLPDPGY